jgi:hypothetical protein
MAQSFTIEPRHTNICWVVQISDGWAFTPQQRKEHETDKRVSLEFRRSPLGDGEILIAAWVNGASGPQRIYSSNSHWISTRASMRPRRATSVEWAGAEVMRVDPGTAKGCAPDKNGVSCGGRRFDRTHTTPRVDTIYTSAYRSPDGRWLAVDGWDGRTLFHRGGGFLGDFPGSGGVDGAKGHEYADIFEFATARIIATAGGDFNGWPPGRFAPLRWLPPHYLYGVLDKTQRKFLFCNPARAEMDE